MDVDLDAHVCPVCTTSYARNDGAASALHLTDCTSPGNSSPTAFRATIIDGVAVVVDNGAPSTQACRLCHHVYAKGTAAHVIEFHENECARVNRRSGGDSESSSSSSASGRSQGKRQSTRQRHRRCSSRRTARSGASGRALLQCSGSCARVFHAACLDDVRAGNSRVATPGVSGLASTRTWRCAECARGVHACRTCGFLGHESNTLVQCSVANCGVFFHTDPPCRPPSMDASGPFVCPRHTCDTCGDVETDMRLCESCPECFTDVNLRRCDTHTVLAVGRVKPSPDVTLALQYRALQGDLVLILELANALLPASAKLAAPDACNQWGVVTRAEDVDGREQLLSVRLFSDNSVVSVPTRYVLVLGSANAFATPQTMVRECIKWHTVTELNLHRTELDALRAANDTTTTPFDERRDQVLNASCAAFVARAEQLSLSIAERFRAATEGFTFWTTHRTELKQFEGSGAPIYVLMDTRMPAKCVDSGTPSGTGDKSDDVDMDDAAGGDAGGDDSDSGGNTTVPSPASPSGRTSLQAGTSMSHRPVDSVAASSVQTLTTDIVSATLNDMVASVEQAAATAPATDTSSALASPVASGGPDVTQSNTIEASGAASTTLNTTTVGSDAGSAKVEVLAKNEATVKEADGEVVRASKRQKLADADKQPIKSQQHQQPLQHSAVTEPTPTLTPTASTRTRKARVLAEYSPQLLEELARQAAVFFEEDANPKRRRKALHPKHRDDAFPFASAAASFRPPYFRPSVVFNHAHGRRMNGLSRILLSQDKRNIKCYIQGTDENRCLHATTATVGQATVEPTFVTIDLMSVDSFRALEVVIRARMVAAVEHDERHLTEIFGTNATHARRLLTEKRSRELKIAIYYCSYNGSRSKVVREKDDWLCFCANVCHLTTVVSVHRNQE